MSRTEFNCRRCGHCCLTLVDAYNGCVSEADLARWRQSGRHDLLAWVQTLELAPGNTLHLAWVDPESGEDVERCPWLAGSAPGNYACAIEALKPDHCRAYPEHREHAGSTGCPGYLPSLTAPTPSSSPAEATTPTEELHQRERLAVTL